MAFDQFAEMDLFNVEADMASFLDDKSNEELHLFIKLHEYSTSDEQIGLHIYACFLLSMRTQSAEHLEQAIQRAKVWPPVAERRCADRAWRFQVLDKVATRMNQGETDFDDIMWNIYESILGK
jgi:hypothetical protein